MMKVMEEVREDVEREVDFWVACMIGMYGYMRESIVEDHE
jgi:hypothetical protein